MKQILLIVAVLAYLCLSNLVSLYDAFVDELQYEAWPKCRSPWSK